MISWNVFLQQLKLLKWHKWWHMIINSWYLCNLSQHMGLKNRKSLVLSIDLFLLLYFSVVRPTRSWLKCWISSGAWTPTVLNQEKITGSPSRSVLSQRGEINTHLSGLGAGLPAEVQCDNVLYRPRELDVRKCFLEKQPNQKRVKCPSGLRESSQVSCCCLGWSRRCLTDQGPLLGNEDVALVSRDVERSSRKAQTG